MATSTTEEEEEEERDSKKTMPPNTAQHISFRLIVPRSIYIL
jgi:hypothetical protein